MNRIEIFRPGKFKAMNGTEVSFSAEMLKDIAERQNISKKYLEIIVKVKFKEKVYF